MKFKSQICTAKNQSERLLALGLKKETADMALIENWDYDLKDGKFFTGEYFERPIDYVEGMTGHYIPAWSLHRLLRMLPSYVRIETYEYGRKYIAALDLELDAHLNVIYKEGVEEPCYDQYFFINDAYESVCRAIEWLIKEGYFPKEYLV